eukprot:c26239_g1_i1 orf=357-1637(-)
MSTSSQLCNLRCCPGAQSQHRAFRRPHVICKQLQQPSDSPLSNRSSRSKIQLLSAVKSAPPVVSPDTEIDGHNDEAAALSRQFYRGHLEELLHSSPAPASPSSTTWWESIFPFLSSPRVRGILLLNLLTFLYGSNIPIVKETEAVANPSLFLCGRFMLATMVFAPYIADGIRDVKIRNASIELGLWISMGYWTQSFGLLSTDAGRASFISAFTVIAVPILAGLSGREISKLTWASAITAFVGVGLLETSGSPASVGDIWTLLSAVLFGVHMLRTEHYSRAISSKESLPLLGMQLLVITLSSLLWSLVASTMLTGSSLPSLHDLDINAAWQSISHMPWLPVVYTGTVSTAFCLWIELTAMRDISATDMAIIYSLEPLWGAAFAWCFLGERWGIKGWFGALLILGGSLAVQLFQARDSVTHSDDSKEA